MVTAPPPHPNRRRCGSRKIREVQTEHSCATRPRGASPMLEIGVGFGVGAQSLVEVRLSVLTENTYIQGSGFHSGLQ